ncbi:hypothetical protein SBBP2_890011 [Burkholderiales bacterium]|nr:hypothetical protein SBBP2_890011 [Burkholderiales bacterium]
MCTGRFRPSLRAGAPDTAVADGLKSLKKLVFEINTLRIIVKVTYRFIL